MPGEEKGLQGKESVWPETSRRKAGNSKTVISTLIIINCTVELVLLASVTRESKGCTLQNMIRGKVFHQQMLRLLVIAMISPFNYSFLFLPNVDRHGWDARRALFTRLILFTRLNSHQTHSLDPLHMLQIQKKKKERLQSKLKAGLTCTVQLPVQILLRQKGKRSQWRQPAWKPRGGKEKQSVQLEAKC